MESFWYLAGGRDDSRTGVEDCLGVGGIVVFGWIAFAAWSSFAHGAVMAVLAVHITSERGGLLSAVAVLVIIGVALIALAPAKQSFERVSAA